MIPRWKVLLIAREEVSVPKTFCEQEAQPIIIYITNDR